MGNLPPTRVAVGLQHLQNGDALARAQVEGEEGVAVGVEQMVEGAAVAFGQIHHMDVVPHATAIHRGPIVPEHRQAGSLSHRHLADDGEQIGGLPVGVLTDAAAGMGAHRVEVAEASDAPAGLAGRDIGQQLLHRRFGVAIGMERTHRRALGDRQGFGVPVEGGAAAEDQNAAVVAPHGLQEAAAAVNVDIPVEERLSDGFRQGLQTGEMEHRPHGPQGHGALHIGGSPHIPLNHRQAGGGAQGLPDPGGWGRPWRQVGQPGHPSKGLELAVDEAVEHHHRVARFEEAEGGVAADESPATCDEQIGQLTRGPPFSRDLTRTKGGRGSLRRETSGDSPQ